MINPIDSRPAWHISMIQLNLKKLKVGCREIFEVLLAENIGVNVHYIPVHLQPYYRRRFAYQKGDFSIAEKYYSQATTLPIFPKMSKKDIDDIIMVAKKIVSYYKR